MTEIPYELGTVTRILQEQRFADQETPLYTQVIEVKKHTDNQVVEIPIGNEFQPITESQRLTAGTKVIVSKQEVDGQPQYFVADVYRLPIINWLFAGFVLLVLLVGRWRGLASLLGMVISLGILLWFLVPHILAGRDPFIGSLVTSAGIAFITIYLSHGINARSHLALGSLLITLLAVTALSSVSVTMAQLVGLGTEEAYYLQMGTTNTSINVQGLLLGGILLGALGVLDDIIVSQVSVVNQLFAANRKLSVADLYQRSLEVGKDHVASLVNTLVLAYAGANLPLFLLFYTNKSAPFWVNLNSEIIMEEVVRTLVGSIGLVLAVPLTTALAVVVLHRLNRPFVDHATHKH